jgi:hypothetical protein
VEPEALGGHLPATFPIAVYMRDRPLLPAGSKVLALGGRDEPVVFQVRDNCLGFLGHPGIKSGMVEDLIMEFEDVPEGTAEMLVELRAVQGEIASALGEIMVGLIKLTHLMESHP